MHNVFVYGTLKRGQPRHNAMAGQKLICTATTVPDYRMFNLGSYPGLVDAPGRGDRVGGEVFQIDPACRRLLDVIEDVASGLYEFKPIQLAQCSDLGPVYAYFYLGDVGHCAPLTSWPPDNSDPINPQTP